MLKPRHLRASQMYRVISSSKVASRSTPARWLGSVATLPLLILVQPSAALAAPPSLVNVCTGLGVTLPVLQPLAAVAGGLLTAPVLSALNGVVGNVNTDLQGTLSGRTLGVGVIDPSTGTLASVPSGQCTVSGDGFAVDNNVGITLGGGQINGLGGTGNPLASAGDASAIALGNGASTATGVTNTVALGTGATSTAANSVALGANAVATRGAVAGYAAYGLADPQSSAGEVSVGSAGALRQITNVAAGSAPTDAINVAQLRGAIDPLSHRSVQYDTDAAGNTLSSVTLNSDQGGPVIIHNLAPGVAGSDAATVGQVQSATANSVQYVTVNGQRTNTVALVGGATGPVTISNVAAGVNPNDAVNVSQLQGIGAGALASANAYTDRQIGRVRNDLTGGVALALAATGLRYDDRPGKISVTGATSYYHDQVGLAFGIGATSESGRLRFNAAVTASPTMDRPDVGAVVGASYALN